MTSSKPTPGNLKERIAALQQQSISPPPQRTSPSASSASASPLTPQITGSGNSALRDRIAKFEKKGGVPIPRGSFGMGAPPLPENAPPKRRGELYGNRMASVPTQWTGNGMLTSQRTGSGTLSTHTTGNGLSATSTGTAYSRDQAPSSFSIKNPNRRFSMSNVQMEGNFDDLPSSLTTTTPISPLETPSLPSSPPVSDGLPKLEPEKRVPVPETRTPFSQALEAAQQSSNSVEKLVNDVVREERSMSPTPFVVSSTPLTISPKEEVKLPVIVVDDPPEAIVSPAAAPFGDTSAPENSDQQNMGSVSPAEQTEVTVETPVEPTVQAMAEPVVKPAADVPRKIAVEATVDHTNSSTKDTGAEAAKKQHSHTVVLPNPRSEIRPVYVEEPEYDPFSYVENPKPKKSTFSAVVHRRAATTTPTTEKQEPTTLSKKNGNSAKVMAQSPTSSGIGELASLMQEAVMLEVILGNSPSLDDTAPANTTQTDVAEPTPVSLPSTSLADQENVESKHTLEKSVPKKSMESMKKKLSLKKKRSSGGTSLKRSKSLARKSSIEEVTALPPPSLPAPSTAPAPVSSTEPLDHQYSVRKVASPEPVTTLAQQGHQDVPSRQSTVSTVHTTSLDEGTSPVPPTPPPKPSTTPTGSKYFSSLRRLGSSSGTSTLNVNHSNNPGSQSAISLSSETKATTVSSTDDPRSLEITSDEFGVAQPRQSKVGGDRPRSIYSVNSVKSGISRASTFAGKMWSKNKTRSNAGSGGGKGSKDKLSSPSMTSFSQEPGSLPATNTQTPLELVDTHVSATTIQPPARSSSLTPHSSPSETNRPTSVFLSPPSIPPLTLSSPPAAAGNDARPLSMVSIDSSTTMSPSPLFDVEFFNSFPAVPDGLPIGSEKGKRG